MQACLFQTRRGIVFLEPVTFQDSILCVQPETILSDWKTDRVETKFISCPRSVSSERADSHDVAAGGRRDEGDALASARLEEWLSIRAEDRGSQVGSTLDNNRPDKLACLRHNLERVALATDQVSLDDDLSRRGGCDRRGQQHSEREVAQ